MKCALIVLALIAGCRSHLSISPDINALAQVRTIYVGDFGKEDGADLVKEKLRLRLLTSSRFVVVETQDAADAVLTGSAGVDKSTSEGTTNYHGTGLLRLVERSTQRTIWAHEYKRGWCFACSVSTRVANQMADRLLKDATAIR